MTKKTLMVVSDGATTPTGFGRVSEAILDRLHETGQWTIKQLGINYFDEDHDKPYRIFSASAGGAQGDWVGYTRIKRMYDELNPDVLFLFQDFWHIAEYIARVPHAKSLVTYFPVDSKNVKYSWALPQAKASEVCTYTNFAAQEFSKAMTDAKDQIVEKAILDGKSKIKLVNMTTREGTLDLSVNRMLELCDPSSLNIVPHGVDNDHFFPKDKKECRRKLSLPEDAFIVGNVNRNQPRKRLDLTIKAFSMFAKDKSNVFLLMHDSLKTHEGWDLAQLAHYYGVTEKVMLSADQYPTEVVNDLYNSFDVMVNSSGGEGFGLTPFESAGCKVPQIVPDWSATKEIWEGTGLLTRVLTTIHLAGKINTEQCCVDENHLAEQLQFLYDNPEKAKEIGEACYQETRREYYDWDRIANQFNEILHRALENPTPKAKEIDFTLG